MTESGRKRLSSWKEIGTYLGRDARTAIRWEHDRGLPVHRIPGGKGQRVYAYTDELDAWLAHSPADGPRFTRRHWLTAATAALLLLILAVAAPRVWSRGSASRLVLRANGIVALDDAGHAVWDYPLNLNVSDGSGTHTLLEDVDGDGRREAVVSADTLQDGGTLRSSLLFFDDRGTLRWTANVDDAFRFKDEKFDGPWYGIGLSATGRGSGGGVAWALHHHTWWPGIVTTFDGAGHRTGTFVNAGWMTTLTHSTNGKWIVAGGFSNSRNGSAFAVLDAAHPSGSSPEDRGSPYACRDCPAGRPVAYVVVPWTDVAQHAETNDRMPSVVALPNGSIELHANQALNAETIVELSASLEVARRSMSDSFWRAHRMYEQQGLITHSREECPFRNGPPVRVWTPAHGWTTIN